MKRYLISFITVLMVLTLARGVFAREEENPGQRVLQQRENIRQRFQNMSEEEREKFWAEMQQRREQFMNMSEEERKKFRAEMQQRFGGPVILSREQQLKAISEIEKQVAILKAAVQRTISEDRGQIQDLSEEEQTKFKKIMAW